MKFSLSILFIFFYIISLHAQEKGGITFFTLEGKYELIAATHDQTEAKGKKWGPRGSLNTKFPSDGRKNVKILMAQNKPKKFAAYICDTLTLNGFDDWYLPAINELIKLHEAQDLVGGFKMEDYASSTEERSADSWAAHFMPHRKVAFWYNKSEKYQVRCIRRIEY